MFLNLCKKMGFCAGLLGLLMLYLTLSAAVSRPARRIAERTIDSRGILPTPAFAKPADNTGHPICERPRAQPRTLVRLGRQPAVAACIVMALTIQGAWGVNIR